jgi:anti-anti-sigma regulatory factor
MLYSVKFERSAPHWLGSAGKLDPRRKEKRERKDFFAVTPTPDGAILEEIDRFEAFTAKMGSARLDLSKVKHILSEEAELFAIVLQRTRKANIPLWFNSLDDFAHQLKQGINEKVGRPLAESQGYWSLLFELYILDARLQEYEDLGLEYAVAFEMSPPAWAAVTRPSGAETVDADEFMSDGEDAAPIGFPLKGVVSHSSREALQQLSIYAASKPEVAIDMSGLLRIDFAAAGLFMEAIRSIHLSQKRVVLSNINELVAALLEVFGITKHAIIMRKKSA